MLPVPQKQTTTKRPGRPKGSGDGLSNLVGVKIAEAQLFQIKLVAAARGEKISQAARYLMELGLVSLQNGNGKAKREAA